MKAHRWKIASLLLSAHPQNLKLNKIVCIISWVYLEILSLTRELPQYFQ